MSSISPESFWSSPFTRSGRSVLVPRGPWIYALSGVAAHYRADPKALEGVVPKPLRVVDGDVFTYIVEVIAISPNAQHLIDEAPDQLYYNEGAFFVKVEYQGKVYSYCPFMWVDTDISLLRGLLAGWPKKLASIAVTRLHPMLPGLDKPRRGLRLGGYVARSGSTLYRVKILIEGDEHIKSLPLLSEHSILLPRYFAGIAPGMTTVNELVEFVADLVVEAWQGAAEVTITGSAIDEVDAFKPITSPKGYYFNALLKPRSIRVVGKLEGF
ncbi:MAG: acetoacetate decarboxylase family protein [Ignisphaera sp.]|nr:acetoacetate decarboxylase family protein [Ignisphaera sp.]